MDVLKKVNDLSNLAFDQSAANNERLQAALGALRIIQEYKLLSNKKIDVAVNVLDRYTDPAFVEAVAARAEKFADGVNRTIDSFKKVSGNILKNIDPDLVRAVRGKAKPTRRRYG